MGGGGGGAEVGIQIIVFYNAQSTVSVITGRNKSQSLFTVPDISQSLLGKSFGKMNPEKAEVVSRLEVLVVGKSRYARLYSYSRLNKQREPTPSGMFISVWSASLVQ